jgi:hypothetical protein
MLPSMAFLLTSSQPLASASRSLRTVTYSQMILLVTSLSCLLILKRIKNPNAGFVVIDKSSGELCYCPIDEMDMINPVSRIDDIREFLKNDTPPAKCYSAVADGASGNLKLAFGCVYL